MRAWITVTITVSSHRWHFPLCDFRCHSCSTDNLLSLKTFFREIHISLVQHVCCSPYILYELTSCITKPFVCSLPPIPHVIFVPSSYDVHFHSFLFVSRIRYSKLTASAHHIWALTRLKGYQRHLLSVHSGQSQQAGVHDTGMGPALKVGGKVTLGTKYCGVYHFTLA